MATFRVDDSDVQKALNALADHMADPQPALVAIAEDLAENSRLNIIEAQTPWGDAWPPLSEATKAARREEGKGAKPLQDDGHLLASIQGQETGDAAEFGAGVLYAATHQFGREGGGWQGSDIPARPFLPIRPSGEVDLPPAEKEKVQATIREYLEDAG